MTPALGLREWVFDLDNTLYPARDLYDEIGERMTAFIARKLSLSSEDALAVRGLCAAACRTPDE